MPLILILLEPGIDFPVCIIILLYTSMTLWHFNIILHVYEWNSPASYSGTVHMYIWRFDELLMMLNNCSSLVCCWSSLVFCWSSRFLCQSFLVSCSDARTIDITKKKVNNIVCHTCRSIISATQQLNWAMSWFILI